MNIVLIGYRGAGKSAVGKVLSSRLGWRVISTDAEIVRRAGRSIPDIVAGKGWDYFRDLESEVCRELADQDKTVIDTGGGAVLRPQNVEAFKSKGIVVWLTASVDTISTRISGDTQRPSLTGAKTFIEEVQDVLQERTPKYHAAADHVIATDGCSVAQIVDKVLACLPQNLSGTS